MYKLIRPAVFRSDPEAAHESVLGLLSTVSNNPVGLAALRAMYSHDYPQLATELAGLQFPNPVGLAAGYDKDAVAVQGLFALGFGFVELGTVTPRPQIGNPKPRLFRYPQDEAVINRMGFNNEGLDAMKERLANLPLQPGLVGINIGKNKMTPNAVAHEDYTRCLEELFPFGDYFTVNVSSPNTPELRDLQTRSFLADLLGRVQESNRQSASRYGTAEKPVFVKFAPDITASDLDDMVQATLSAGLAGIIATNTTISRDGLSSYTEHQDGGLSGAPLTERARQAIAAIYRRVGGQLPIIGVGGIMRPEDAYLHMRAGASAVQIYTGLIYEGPGFADSVCRYLRHVVNQDDLEDLQLVVGADADKYAEI